MNIKTKFIIALIGSFSLCSLGTYRIVTDMLPEMSLIVAYIFAITGFIGVIANGIALKKVQST
ncbi:hypothetical protein BAMA_05730 [Bacillus manliponensis]|uniref:Uncharacterized protein n=1 Tax=Bacillus manliponensis TaxID=574376 RepID=A0A073JVP3_9BACI|nr:hypothetical protein [Bacillus manliponensis]KEK18281.1 hypothetical protein BAMA_05730 [Bacillus manliponensis]